MPLRMTHLAALTLAVVIPASQANAAPLIVEFPDVIVSSSEQTIYCEEEQFDTYTGFSDYSGVGTYNVTSPFPGETVLEGDILRQTIKAAPGKVFQLIPGFDRLTLEVLWDAGVANVFAQTIVTFNELNGGTLSATGRTTGIGGWVNFAGGDISQPSDTVTFQSVTIEVTTPEDVTVDELPFAAFNFVARRSGNTDTTRYLDLVDVGGPAVPEPSSIALLLMGGVGLIGYGWRKRHQA